MKISLASVCLCAVISVVNAHPPRPSDQSSKKKDPKLIIISLDALMFKQLSKEHTPNLYSFVEDGVHCPQVKPVFPTKTLTNHFSIVTGLYAGSHGVTGNRFYDREIRKVINYQEALYRCHSKDVTPIWTLNQLAGKKSAVDMWSSCEFRFQGILPSYHDKLIKNGSWVPRTEKVVEWMKNDDEVNLLMFYSEQPDVIEHKFSANSKQAEASVQDMDKMVGDLMQRLEEAGLLHKTDIIIVSDHGMNTVVLGDTAHVIPVKKYVDPELYDWAGDSAVMQVIPKNEADIKDIYEAFANPTKKDAEKDAEKSEEKSEEKTVKKTDKKNVEKPDGKAAEKAAGKSTDDITQHFRVYLNENLPEEWCVRNDRTFGPITLVADAGYALDNVKGYYESFQRYDPGFNGTHYGYHGYDNTDPSMQAMFLAKGPRFMKGVEIEAMELVDYYHLFARLLGIHDKIHTLNVNVEGKDKIDTWNSMLKKKIPKGSHDELKKKK